MKNKIEQIIVNHIDRKISLGEATTQILRLFAVSVQCEHPYDSVLKGNGIRPTQCLKCGKALSEH
jgi:hypothetical protein